MSPVTDEQVDQRLLGLGASLPALLTTVSVAAPSRRRPVTSRARAAGAVAGAIVVVAIGGWLVVSRPTTQSAGAGPATTTWPTMRAAEEALTSARGYVWVPSDASDAFQATDPSGATVEVRSPKGDEAVITVIEHGDVPTSGVQAAVLQVISPGDASWLADAYPRMGVGPAGGNMSMGQKLPGGVAIISHDLLAGESTWTLTLSPDSVTSVGFAEASPWPSPSAPGPSLVLMVRNASPGMTWFAVLPETDPPQSVGFDAMTGVACLSFPPGSRLSMLDRSPVDPAARELQTIAVAGGDGTTTAWVDIGADRHLTTGTGTPGWWTDPDPCGPTKP